MSAPLERRVRGAHPGRSVLAAALSLMTLGCVAASAGDPGVAPLAEPEVATAIGPVCEIVAVPVAGGVRLDALALPGPSTAQGAYTLDVERTSAAGSARIRQGGDADFTSADHQALTSVHLSAPVGALDATLTLEIGEDVVVCTLTDADL